MSLIIASGCLIDTSYAWLKEMMNEVPELTFDFTSMDALCAWMIFKVEASPRPIPFLLEVKYGSKSFDRFS